MERRLDAGGVCNLRVEENWMMPAGLGGLGVLLCAICMMCWILYIIGIGNGVRYTRQKRWDWSRYGALDGIGLCRRDKEGRDAKMYKILNVERRSSA
jgi:hypothetical protein